MLATTVTFKKDVDISNLISETYLCYAGVQWVGTYYYGYDSRIVYAIYHYKSTNKKKQFPNENIKAARQWLKECVEESRKNQD